MKVSYDPTANAAYIALHDDVAPGGVARTYACDPVAVQGQISLDFDAEGRLIGIEVMGARSKLPADVLDAAAAPEGLVAVPALGP
jgi:uncharacterized protein YuzE